MGKTWSRTKMTVPTDLNFFDIMATDIHGIEQPMRFYHDNFNPSPPGIKAIIVTNIAGKCGLTKCHMLELVDLYEKYHDKGLEIFGFPSAQFANQEYSKNEEIQEYLDMYDVRFPVFQKVHVNGSNTHPIFQYCKYHSSELGEDGANLKAIGWNFGKFLLDGKGLVVKYFGPRTDPSDMEHDIQLVLDEDVSGKLRSSHGPV